MTHQAYILWKQKEYAAYLIEFNEQKHKKDLILDEQITNSFILDHQLQNQYFKQNQLKLREQTKQLEND